MSLETAIKENQDILQNLGIRHNDIKIVNFLCYNLSTVGYTIMNIGNEPIYNILIPEYKMNAKSYLRKIDLRPGEKLVIPKKWLVLLLFRPEYSLLTSNGEFKRKYVATSDDMDDICNNYSFHSDETIEIINITNKNERYGIEKEYQSTFLYLFSNYFSLYSDSLNLLKYITKDDGDCKCLIRPEQF